MSDPQVLIVGAGPTGLALACELAWRGVAVRVIDKSDGPSRHSKAFAVQARTLEVLENHPGVIAEMLERGLHLRGATIHGPGGPLGSIEMRGVETAFNFLLSLAQSETEALLIARLADLGVAVEWQCELTRLEVSEGGVWAAFGGQGRAPNLVAVPWLVGCDGAHSAVRGQLDLAFEGETMAEAFHLADVRLDWPLDGDRAHAVLGNGGPLAIIPLGGGVVRLIVNGPAGDPAHPRAEVDAAEVHRWLEERGGSATAGAAVGEVLWTSAFTIHRRMVSAMRRGPVLLAGDAAHIHSPAGGQGMNTGIQDAVNLAWKLERVVKGRAGPGLLDSYDGERRPVARAILQATHRATRALTMRNRMLRLVRNTAVRVLLASPLAGRIAPAVADLTLRYGRGPAVEEGGGGRAPDAPLAGARLYDRLRHPGHTLLLFPPRGEEGAAQSLAAQAVASAGDTMRSYVVSHEEQVAWDRYGAGRYAICLIRPDRYIAARLRSLESGPLFDLLGRVPL